MTVHIESMSATVTVEGDGMSSDGLKRLIDHVLEAMEEEQRRQARNRDESHGQGAARTQTSTITFSISVDAARDID